jgi:signal transduction histidine kinase
MADAASPMQSEPTRKRGRPHLPGGLSVRLLMLTSLFVIISGLIVLPPLLAAFEEQWLLDRVRAAELASLATEVAPDRIVTRELSEKLTNGAGVISVAIQSDGMRRLVLAPPRAIETPYLVDLRSQNPGSWLAAPFQTLFGGGGRLVRVVAAPRFNHNGESVEFVEIVTADAPLKSELLVYFLRLAGITAFVAILAGLLVYLSLIFFLVRPMQRITLSMERFRADPEDPRARVVLSHRHDELGRAEEELDRMQADLRAALNSRARLASLGEAVAKINHDLRNMLTSAQMASERLAALGDPKVAQTLPRLERALDRAITLASDVMAYGKSEEAAPVPRAVPVMHALEIAAEDAGLSEGGVRLIPCMAPNDQVSADPDQLHRILVNLLRNAREAIQAVDGLAATGAVAVDLRQEDGVSTMRLADDGPGIPAKAQANLFQPFVGSVRRGGTGLGLAIARELAQGHGGDLVLVETGLGGSVFDLSLPGTPEPLASPAPAPSPAPRKTRRPSGRSKSGSKATPD